MGGTSKSSNKIILPPITAPGVKNPHQRRAGDKAAAGDKNLMQENNRTETLVGDNSQ